MIRICKICNCEKDLSEFKPYRKKDGTEALRFQCRECYNEKYGNYESTIKNRATWNVKRRSSSVYSQDRQYSQMDIEGLVLIHKSALCTYWAKDNGTIYVQNNLGFREVKKRIGRRGYLECKIGNKTVSYKREIAKAFVPNLNDCNKIFSKNRNQFDTHPSNLMWVWRRDGKHYTTQQALERTNDPYLIEYYQNGNKKSLDRGINNVLEKIYSKQKFELIGELYLTIHNYAERCLLFNLKDDIIITYWGLLKQQHRNKQKLISIDSFEKIDKTDILYL